jgi:hypothetical protein
LGGILRRSDKVSFPPIADISPLWLAIRVKAATAVILITLAGCTQQRDVGCPAIDALAHRDAVADARNALARGDRHLLMLGGFVGEIPGVSNSDAYASQMVEGTSDTTKDACRRRRSVARAYAARYNQTIVQPH